MSDIVGMLNRSSDFSPDILNKLFFSLVAIVVLWLIRIVILKFALAKISDVNLRYQWRKSLTYSVSLLGFLVVGRIWIEAFQSISTFLGLLSAGIAIALKEPVVNLAGWLFIVLKRPFEVGNRIEINNQSGDVIDIQVFQFSLLEIGNWVDADQSTGRVIHIPNGMIFNQAIANYSTGIPFLWNEIPVLVTFESNWEKAKDILTRIISENTEDLRYEVEQKLKESQHKHPIQYTKLDPVVYTSVKDSGVMLTIRYLCKPRSRRNSEHAIWEEILRQFAEHPDIDLAYPTQRFYTLKEDAGEV